MKTLHTPEGSTMSADVRYSVNHRKSPKACVKDRGTILDMFWEGFAKRIPQAPLEEPVRIQGCQKGPPRIPQTFFEEPGAHKERRPPKAAATLCVGGRRPTQVLQKGLGDP